VLLCIACLIAVCCFLLVACCLVVGCWLLVVCYSVACLLFAVCYLQLFDVFRLAHVLSALTLSIFLQGGHRIARKLIACCFFSFCFLFSSGLCVRARVTAHGGLSKDDGLHFLFFVFFLMCVLAERTEPYRSVCCGWPRPYRWLCKCRVAKKKKATNKQQRPIDKRQPTKNNNRTNTQQTSSSNKRRMPNSKRQTSNNCK